jgi:hypothetical protein
LIQVNASPRPQPQREAALLEDAMTTNEFYYLVLVLGAFGSFAVAMALAMAQYKSWRRAERRRLHAAE